MPKQKYISLQKKIMKTRLTLFSENLTQDEFNLAFDYTIQSFNDGMKPFDKKFINFEDALSTAFQFDRTIEGANFWYNIIDRVNGHDESQDDISEEYLLSKLVAFNEIIGVAQGYFDIIIEHPDRAQFLAKMANDEIEKRYQKTTKNDKRNN